MASQLKHQHRSQSSSQSSTQSSHQKSDPRHQLILFRHATRASHFDSDTTLSAFGLAQAAAAPSLFELNSFGSSDGSFGSFGSSGLSDGQCREGVGLPQPQEIFCSPKVRAQQTVSPLADFLKLTVQLDERLDERHSHESRATFESRIRSFLAEIEEKFHSSQTCHAELNEQKLQLAQTVVACSHMDWLETILPLMNSNLTEVELTQLWAAGEFRSLHWHPEGPWELGRVGVLLGG